VTPDDQFLADLAAFTVRLERRLARLEADLEQTRRLALDALDLVGSFPAEHDLARTNGHRLH
jgi:hypothetical protein